MSSIRFTSFGAVTVPLSKIIPDKDFDIRPYGITAAFAKFPYRPIAWPTETLDWCDVAASDTQTVTSVGIAWDSETTFTVPVPTKNRRIEVTLKTATDGYHLIRSGAKLLKNDVVVSTITGAIAAMGGSAKFPDAVYISDGDTLKITCQSHQAGSTNAHVTVHDSGFVCGPKTFNLTGKWLALGIDMKGLAATVKIQGVNMPYSDYAKYFPLAPTEITIPGGWDASQERPIIEVYK
jgi:hypothetical protein